ncbi:MAG: type II toxin-antitoxin system HicA family toxin [Desulfovibrio sp.]|nr:type II toxin-antitoxin system HicA family toxin [Desulfovibrio sp.]
MNKKQRETLEAVFSVPVPKNLLWYDIESLLKAIGCKVKNRGGSRVGFGIDNDMLYAHRPHPQKEAKVFAVNNVRAFLERHGVTP